ncbi:MAG TPA: hypothetical protein VII06_22260 [Chloroflexota bacterium]|jgi:hypothetical protein
MAFELWSLASKNLVGDFATEAEALAAVRAAIDAHGAAYADDLLLSRETRRGETRLVARGSVLRDRAIASSQRSIVELKSLSQHTKNPRTPHDASEARPAAWRVRTPATSSNKAAAGRRSSPAK